MEVGLQFTSTLAIDFDAMQSDQLPDGSGAGITYTEAASQTTMECTS